MYLLSYFHNFLLFVKFSFKIVQNTSEEVKIAQILGEEVDNPKITFRAIETVLDDRISTLSNKLYTFVKDYDKDNQGFDNLEKDANNEIDGIENEYFYEIKKHVSGLHEGLDEMDAYSLLLQKQITTLKKEKVDLNVQINMMNIKLDNIEKDLGINIAAKRAKKKI